VLAVQRRLPSEVFAAAAGQQLQTGGKAELSTCKLEQGSKGWEISNQWRPHQPQWQLGMVGGNGHKGLWRRTRAMGSFWRRSYGHRQASLRYTLDSTDGIVLYHDSCHDQVVRRVLRVHHGTKAPPGGARGAPRVQGGAFVSRSALQLGAICVISGGNAGRVQASGVRGGA